MQALWHEAGWLAAFIFGIPTLVIGIVCYALCCIEPVDDDESFEGEEEEGEPADEKNIEPPPKYDSVGTARLRKRGECFVSRVTGGTRTTVRQIHRNVRQIPGVDKCEKLSQASNV